MIKLSIFLGSDTSRCISAVGRATLYILLVSLFGCVSASARFDQAALDGGFNIFITSGGKFQHAIYENAETAPNAKSLNVYVGSDGTPWNSNVPAKDPTPRNPLTLRLMMQDPQPAILVGRPCYHGLSNSDGCGESYWTSARYSQVVVQSMAGVIEEYLDQHSIESVTLIGYSGGGTLVALIAAELDQVGMVLTVAANLDTDAWTRHHNYEPLSASLNPSDQPPLPDSIRQVHFYGARDANVPMETTERYFQVNGSAERREVADFDHVCCWVEIWGSILSVAEKND